MRRFQWCHCFGCCCTEIYSILTILEKIRFAPFSPHHAANQQLLICAAVMAKKNKRKSKEKKGGSKPPAVTPRRSPRFDVESKEKAAVTTSSDSSTNNNPQSNEATSEKKLWNKGIHTVFNHRLRTCMCSDFDNCYKLMKRWGNIDAAALFPYVI